MQLKRLIWFAGIVSLAVPTLGQAPPAVSPSSGTQPPPRFEVGLGFNYLHANAPPGSCQCFSLNGGYASLAFYVSHGLNLVADGSAAFAGDVDGSKQSMLISNYLFGPRYSWRRGARKLVPFGQALLGGSTELSNVAPVQHVSAFAFGLGGGVNAELAHHLGLKLGEADWVHSLLPNGSNDLQNNLRITSGIVIRF